MKKKTQTQTTNTAGYRRKATIMTNKVKYYQFVAKNTTTKEVVKKSELCQRRMDATQHARSYYDKLVDGDASIYHGWSANRQNLSAIYGDIVLKIIRLGEDYTEID